MSRSQQTHCHHSQFTILTFVLSSTHSCFGMNSPHQAYPVVIGGQSGDIGENVLHIESGAAGFNTSIAETDFMQNWRMSGSMQRSFE